MSLIKLNFPILTCLITGTLLADPLTQQLLWDQKEKELTEQETFKSIELKEAVIALNLLGFKTASHSDRGQLLDILADFPWIEIVTEGMTELLEIESDNLSDLIDDEQEDLNKQHPDLLPDEILALPEAANLQALKDQYFVVIGELQKIYFKNQRSLQDLLTLFYQNRKVNYDALLVMQGDILHSIGGPLQIFRSDEEKALHYLRYQQELSSFANFLKDYYLNKG